MTLGSKKGLSKAEIKSDRSMKEKEARLSEIMEEYKKRGVESSQIRQTTRPAWDKTKEVLANVEQAEKFLDYAEKEMKSSERAESIQYKVKPLLNKIELSLWKVSFIDQDLRKKINRIREAVRRAEREVRGI